MKDRVVDGVVVVLVMAAFFFGNAWLLKRHDRRLLQQERRPAAAATGTRSIHRAFVGPTSGKERRTRCHARLWMF
jgi:hypothetical protein